MEMEPRPRGSTGRPSSGHAPSELDLRNIAAGLRMTPWAGQRRFGAGLQSPPGVCRLVLPGGCSFAVPSWPSAGLRRRAALRCPAIHHILALRSTPPFLDSIPGPNGLFSNCTVGFRGETQGWLCPFHARWARGLSCLPISRPGLFAFSNSRLTRVRWSSDERSFGFVSTPTRPRCHSSLLDR